MRHTRSSNGLQRAQGLPTLCSHLGGRGDASWPLVANRSGNLGRALYLEGLTRLIVASSNAVKSNFLAAAIYRAYALPLKFSMLRLSSPPANRMSALLLDATTASSSTSHLARLVSFEKTFSPVSVSVLTWEQGFSGIMDLYRRQQVAGDAPRKSLNRLSCRGQATARLRLPAD
jgi:hypothetical protein